MAASISRLRSLCKTPKFYANLLIVRHSRAPPNHLYPVQVYRRSHPYERKEYIGEPPIATQSWAELQEELNKVDKDVAAKVNIGDVAQSHSKESWSQAQKAVAVTNKQNMELELKTRRGENVPSLVEIDDVYRVENSHLDTMTIAKHYGIFDDLFREGYFVPTTLLDVYYACEDSDEVISVLRGNEIYPAEAKTTPTVSFNAEEGNLYTLILTNPDGHLMDNESEYLHWMISNIKDGDIKTGEVLCDYLRPFPPRGTGWHRYVFLLFKQTGQLDLSKEQRTKSCTSLRERTFNTYNFFKEHQDNMTPVGLSFFQTEWDRTVKHTFHHILNMRQPSFEYAFQQEYRAPQRLYPDGQSFDRYFDKYRDKKELAEDAIRERLKTSSPFEPPKGIDPYGFVFDPTRMKKPSWLQRKQELMYRRVEYFKDLNVD